MLDTRFGYAQLDGGQTFYETAGHGEDLILLHTGFVDSCMWDPQWEILTQHYRVTRFDLRGYGKSSVADREMTRREELHRLLNHLEIVQAHVLGCGLGGTVSIDFALEHPDRVKSLILTSTLPSGFKTDYPSSPKFMEMKAALEARNLRRASELQLQLWGDGPFRQPMDVDRQIRQTLAEMTHVAVANKTWLTIDSNPVNPLTPSAVDRLSDIQAPTFIIAGGLDDPSVVAAADAMAAHIKQAQMLLMPDCGHMLNMEKPRVFTQAVLTFLATVR